MNPTKPLKVLVFEDGRPGHVKQSRAVVRALARLTALCQTTVSVPLPGPLSVAADAVRFFFESPTRIRNRWPDADLAIGTGTGTHLPMLVYRRARPTVRVVTCMLPEPLLRRYFDLCLVPRHDRPVDAKNIMLTIGPPCLVPDNADRKPGRGLILVGGVDEKSHFWQTSRLIAQLEKILAGFDKIYWVIASSPRTPADTLNSLARLAESSPRAEFYPAHKTCPGWIETQYAASCFVWVTADSVSMLYEALSAGCRVGVLPVKWKKMPNKFQLGLEQLAADGRVVFFEQWQTGRKGMPQQDRLDEAGRCAREILQRWWPARLT